MIFRYADLDPQKKAFVFELDDVLFPRQDYYLQVYYLFAAFLEHTEQLNSKETLALMLQTYQTQGEDAVFTSIKTAFNLDGKYQENFERLLKTARLPLKLLLYKQILELLQQIVIDRKQLFILTNGDPETAAQQNPANGMERFGKIPDLLFRCRNQTKTGTGRAAPDPGRTSIAASGFGDDRQQSGR